MMLIVVFSSRISPRASTSIFLVRSPRATAVVTSAMLRTWAVSVPAMKFTESVRSRQVPDAPRTSAWPPSRPSEPTSRATRVTSSANPDSWSTIVFTVVFSPSSSPATSTVILRDRSPRATAVVTWAMSRSWAVRLPAIELTLSVRSFQVPATPGTVALPPSTPSVPTSRATRVTSSANARSWSTIVFTVVFSSSISPATSTVTVRDRSPLATAVVTSGDVADLVGQPAGHRVHRVGQVPPGAGDAADPGLAAELAVGADLAGDPGHLVGEVAQLGDHAVDGPGHPEELAAQPLVARAQVDHLGQVAGGDRAEHPADLDRGPDQLVDQVVGRGDGAGPGALGVAGPQPLVQPAVPADHPAYPVQLAGQVPVALDHLVDHRGQPGHRLRRRRRAPAAGPGSRRPGRR